MSKIEDHGLRKILKPGQPVTLVLGAGVSRARGLPLWSELLREAWRLVFDEDPYASDSDFLHRARSACQREGLPSALVDRLDVRRHPLELQFAFEEIFDRLRWAGDDAPLLKRIGVRPRAKNQRVRLQSNEQRTSDLLTALLRKILYAQSDGMKNASTDTLSLVAQAVRRSALGDNAQRLISQVITFNVDDVLEREVNGRSSRSVPLAIPIHRASAVRPLPVRKAIAIYHLHGFVPKNASVYPFRLEDGSIDNQHVRPPAESLVFTDEQYWRSIASLGGFASRVFLGALSGRCVFIGLSMTDLNIFRWLALDAIERSDDFRRLTADWRDPREAEFDLLEDLSRHYWVTERVEEEEEFQPPFGVRVLRNTLRRRGINTIDIPSWESIEFRTWWKDRFLA